MKKTLIALAVAGVVAAPAAMAEVTVYGLAHVSIDNVSSDVAGDTTLAVTSRASRVGVKAAEDLGDGLKAVAQMEWQVDMSEAAGAAANITSRNQIVGLAGGFGTIALGRHDTPYKMSTGSLDPFADTAADYNAIIGTPAGLENRGNDVIAYLSPDMGGFSLQAAIAAADADDTAGDDANAADVVSIAGQYKNGPLFVSVAMETFEDEVATGGGAGQSGTRVGFGYDFGAVKLGAVVETATDVGAGDDDFTATLVNVVIPMGSNAIIAEVGANTLDDADVDTTLTAVGFSHSFSKTASAYVAGGAVTVDGGAADGDTTIITAGAVVKF